MIENNKKPNFFGGYRILGYLNEKPLIAKYKLDKNGFEFGFSQEILDKEYAGKFNNQIKEIRNIQPTDKSNLFQTAA
tara:strand:+ start:214 stop:444 length:231 start_codon:yes stop_codon:yes gene_type:complete